MSQRLILPMNDLRCTCTWKHPLYELGGKKATHYGLDCSDRLRKDFTIWASGNGEVKAFGYDNIMGNVVVVVYKECVLHNGSVTDLTFRYCHLKSINNLKVGQKVTKDTRLGVAGNTGKYAGAGVHLHLEVDLDTDDRYVCWTPTLSGNSNIFKKGTDSTINPLTALWVKTSSPDYQAFCYDNNSWVDKSIKMPTVK